MNSTTTSAYRVNRERHTIDELRPYNGKWVAFSRDGCRILAGSASLADASAQVDAAGEDPDDVVFERIELEADDVYVGGSDVP
jgi:hypothetical protein